MRRGVVGNRGPDGDRFPDRVAGFQLRRLTCPAYHVADTKVGSNPRSRTICVMTRNRGPQAKGAAARLWLRAGAVNSLVLITGVLTLPRSGHTQEVVQIDTRRPCAACTIELRRVVTLGNDTASPVTVGPTEVVRRDSRGRYYTVHNDDGARISVFSADGRPLQVVGREGKGPGEYRWILGLEMGRGDTIHVFDESNRRETILGPQYDFVQSRPIPRTFPDGIRLIGRDQLFINAHIATLDKVGIPLHTAVGDSIINSFGGSGGTFLIGDAEKLSRKIAVGPSGLWAGWRLEYRIELWDASGHILRVFRRAVPWFERRERFEGVGPERVPQTRLSDVREIGGNLWILIAVGDIDWRRGLRPWVGAVGRVDGETHRIEQYQYVYDTVIEVVDLPSGRLVSTKRVRDFMPSFIDDEHVFGYRVDEDGQPRLDIWRVWLTNPQGR